MLSKSATHAVNALVLLAALPEDEYMGASALAERIDAPPNYLGKLLSTLSGDGLVHSRKGLGGGFRLARPAAKISIFDVVDPIDHLSSWESCFMGMAECSERKPCPMHEQWKVVRDEVLDMLRETSLADVAAQDGQG